jgi:hypothetical protein
MNEALQKIIFDQSPINLMSLRDFIKSLYYEKEDEVKDFLMKYDINKPENELGCVSDTLWFIVSVCKFHTLVHRFSG